MHKVTVNGKLRYAQDRVVLSELLDELKIVLDHPCGRRGVCGKCTVKVNGRDELACKYRVVSDIVVEIPEEEIYSETGVKESRNITENLCFVLDIGTTTLALALVSFDDGRAVKVITRTNPQRTYGADVMTRIDHCRKNGVSELRDAIVGEVNSMIARFGSVKCEKLYVSGNTTMLHLFFGIDCSSMGVAPYTPAFLGAKTLSARDIGIAGIDTVISLPCISSFVGADIVAGTNLIGTPPKGKYDLLIDLGTNAEIVLFSENDSICSAAAAGPCFEGANISFGMSATDGAIYSYSQKGYKTISDMPPKGICGSGLVDVVATLLDSGVVDETGFMEDGEFKIADGVSVNQADIRQYQLAKSAVRSALDTLLQLKELAYDDIDKCYISGGFSANINIENAISTGLLPKEIAKKCVTLNNSSLLGTIKYACEKNALDGFVNNARYIDLSADALFSELFVQNMMFES